MGNSVMSTLQGVGQTGNEIGAGAISAQQQSHQFLMDYLARQAQTRGLDIAQSGQEQVGRIAAGQQDIERQRMQQSRWQLMPGYTKIPHPTNPSQTLYRHTFMDPITKQQTFYDADQPPPGSPEYIMNGYNYADQFAKKAGITLSVGQKLAFGGMKVDTPEENNQRFAALYDTIAADPDGLKYLKDTYKGGKGQFIDEHVKAGLAGYSKEDQLKMIRDFVSQGKDATGKPIGDPQDKLFLDTLQTSLKSWQDTLDKATTDIQKNGLMGEWSGRNEAPKQRVASAQSNIDRIKGQIELLQNRIAGQYRQQDIPQIKVEPFKNPDVPHPSDGQTATGPNGHKIIVMGGQWVDAITKQPIAAASGSSQ